VKFEWLFEWKLGEPFLLGRPREDGKKRGRKEGKRKERV